MHSRWHELAALFLTTAAALIFEVTTTKIFEYSVWANYAYLVISTAMFGLGLSGVVLTRWPGLLRQPAAAFLPAVTVAAAATVAAGFLVLNYVPIHLPEAPEGWGHELGHVAIVFLSLGLPFVFVGLAATFLFTHRGERANLYYFADLLGAGVGCFLMMPLISVIEPQGLLLLAVFMLLAASVLFSLAVPVRVSIQALRTVLVLLVLMGMAVAITPRVARWVPLRVHVQKRNYLQHMRSGQIEHSAWSVLSRIDIAAQANFKVVWIAGGVNVSVIRPFDGDFIAARTNRDVYLEAAARSLDHKALPYLSKTNFTTCIIGTSGGEDSLYALMCGARKVTGIEMDPMIVRFVTNEYRQFVGGLFTDGQYSEIIVDEGRSYLRRSGRQFDVIQQVNNFTPIAFMNGALNLSENYLLTVESFGDFYDHLTPDGILSISRYNAARALRLAVEMLRRRGMPPAEYAKHLFVGEGGSWVLNTLMVKKSAFTPAEIDRLFAFYQVGRQRQILYAPYREQELPDLANNVYYHFATAGDPARYDRLGPFDLSPVTDDRPFFGRIKRLGVKEKPPLRRTIPFLPEEVFRVEPSNVLDYRIPPENLPPLIILAESFLLATVFFGVPLLSRKDLRAQLIVHRRTLGYFACIGLGFIFIELCLIQQLVLFLGAPVYSLTLVIAGLLVSAGLGALCSGLVAPSRRALWVLLVVVGVTILTVQLAMPWLTRQWLGGTFSQRIAVALAITGTCGFFMGLPMPSGIRYLKTRNLPIIPWAWGINGYFTVIGSALSVLLFTTAGFTMVFYGAVALYLLAPCFLESEKAMKASASGG